jgi:hypothetical protein
MQMRVLFFKLCVAIAMGLASASLSAAGTQQWSNNSVTTLASNASSSATTLTVSSSTAFPSLSGGNWFVATLEHIVSGVVTVQEIVKVTAVSGTTWTVVRGQETTAGVAWSAGDTVALLPTAGGLSQFLQAGSISGDCTVSGADVITCTTLNGQPPIASTSGSFALSVVSGLTTTPSATAYWRMVGSAVWLLIPPLSGTSNSTAFTLSGLPSQIQVGSSFGSNNVIAPMAISENNSAYTAGAYAIIPPSSSSFSIGLLGVQNGWTASGVKSVAGMITYSIN